MVEARRLYLRGLSALHAQNGGTARRPYGLVTPDTLRSVGFVDYRDRITIEPNKRGGKPCVRGLRITVHEVLDYLASGMSEEEILRDFPDLDRDDILACLAFAADRERRLMSIPPG